MKLQPLVIAERLIFACALVALGACRAPNDVASPSPAVEALKQIGAPAPPLPVAPVVAPTPASPGTPFASAMPKAGGFASAPPIGWIIRSNCRMGGCNWERFGGVQRSGSDDAPVYALRLMQGDSTHPQDPYPLQPEGVDIRWRSQPIAMQIKCSRSAPRVAFDGQSEALKLNPQGVSGVMQGAANIYFATCHGEYGNDADLAKKHGYNLR